MKKLSYLLCGLILIASAEMLFSCKYTNYAAKREQASTDRRRDAKARQAQKEYRKAKKSHLNRQDKITKKRMQQTVKQQKKQYSGKKR